MIQRHSKLPFMHRVVEHKDTLYFGGMAADEREGVDAAGQMRQIAAKIDRFLAEYGSDKSRILTATVYLVSYEDKSAINPIWIDWLGDDLPSRAAITVADLGPDVRVEVKIIAAKAE